MQAPCERVGKKLLPSIRGMVVRYMYKDLGLTELQIARLLGVSQSSISRYINQQRGKWATREKIPELEEKIRELTHLFLEKKTTGSDLLCEICRSVRATHPELLA